MAHTIPYEAIKEAVKRIVEMRIRNKTGVSVISYFDIYTSLLNILRDKVIDADSEAKKYMEYIDAFMSQLNEMLSEYNLKVVTYECTSMEPRISECTAYFEKRIYLFTPANISDDDARVMFRVLRKIYPAHIADEYYTKLTADYLHRYPEDIAVIITRVLR